MNDAGDAAARREREALELFKHYSNLRFVMLPIFFTTMGAMGLAYDRILTARPNDVNWLGWMVILISALFASYEFRLSRTLEHIANELPRDLLPRGGIKRWGVVTYTTILLYLTPIAFALVRAT